MIAGFTGQVVRRGAGYVVIDVSGVHYKVSVSPQTLGAIAADGEQVQLSTFMYVPEDVLQLHGFRLAEEDLRLRGAGELIGSRQHGVSDLAMEQLRNPTLVDEAREEAAKLVAADPDLDRNPALAAAVERLLDRMAMS